MWTTTTWWCSSRLGPRLGCCWIPSREKWSKRSPWPPPAHHLDRIPRLSACYSTIRERRPSARILVFVDCDGYRQLCAEWQAGSGALALPPSSVQCVPFGGGVGDFLLEVGRQRAVEGCEVAIVSNVVDTVVKSRSADVRLTHLSFMFVDGSIVMPGLQPSRALDSGAAPASASVLHARGGQQTIGKRGRERGRELGATPRAGLKRGRSAAALGGDEANGIALISLSASDSASASASASVVMAPPLLANVGLATVVEECEEREECETLHDSQLDGEVLSTCVDDPEEAFADTVVDFAADLPPAPLSPPPPPPTFVPTVGSGPLASPAGLFGDEFAYADTLVDVDVNMADDLPLEEDVESSCDGDVIALTAEYLEGGSATGCHLAEQEAVEVSAAAPSSESAVALPTSEPSESADAILPSLSVGTPRQMRGTQDSPGSGARDSPAEGGPQLMVVDPPALLPSIGQHIGESSQSRSASLHLEPAAAEGMSPALNAGATSTQMASATAETIEPVL
mmetsp:Transcript_76734/g.248454  ORF Transcript_76734/g.248454 Transcript_76734/m.248454 type:complete len:512 (+) Transcript_76734:108-1643(+)